MAFFPEYIRNDEYLMPFKNKIIQTLSLSFQAEAYFVENYNEKLKDKINGHLFYGVHLINDEFVFREWIENATAVYFLCSESNWTKNQNFKFYPIGDGNWEFKISKSQFQHADFYKILVEWNEGTGERIPAWANRVVQDENTKLFAAQLWLPPNTYQWKFDNPPKPETILIYEAHVGMSLEDGKVASFNEFKKFILPRIYNAGYTVLQLMAIQEHPYYGSFGYHVSSFFAATSRFGTPEELKELIDEAHGLGILVIMDIVHSHAVKNEVEGISKYDGTLNQFFHEGNRGFHQAWDSRCFNYGKPQVLNFLLSNCKYWLEEYHFDGFRFDGVTSMIFKNHGLEQDFLSYADYFNDNLDQDALVYLRLANKLIHQINPNTITVAEDMSGFPGMGVNIDNGGIGFDFRMAMGIPDYWIKIIKEFKDEDWNVSEMYQRLTDKRFDEYVVSYAESHDQALVGDQTIIFRLIGAEMYWHMDVSHRNLIVDRGIALHKMIRLITCASAGGAYLNFMGNEFGHPEWIDFPREGNNWSYHYARRQWSLIENTELRYRFLWHFDNAMIDLVKQNRLFNFSINYVFANDQDQVLSFVRGNYLFVFNFNPEKSFFDYGFKVNDNSSWQIVLNTDNKLFDGFNRIDESLIYKPIQNGIDWFLKVYIPARTAFVLRKLE